MILAEIEKRTLSFTYIHSFHRYTIFLSFISDKCSEHVNVVDYNVVPFFSTGKRLSQHFVTHRSINGCICLCLCVSLCVTLLIHVLYCC